MRWAISNSQFGNLRDSADTGSVHPAGSIDRYNRSLVWVDVDGRDYVALLIAAGSAAEGAAVLLIALKLQFFLNYSRK